MTEEYPLLSDVLQKSTVLWGEAVLMERPSYPPNRKGIRIIRPWMDLSNYIDIEMLIYTYIFNIIYIYNLYMLW